MEDRRNKGASAPQARSTKGQTRGATLLADSPGLLETIRQGAIDGSENVARRTAIMVTPSVGQHSTRQADPVRVANWQARVGMCLSLLRYKAYLIIKHNLYYSEKHLISPYLPTKLIRFPNAARSLEL